MNEMDTKYQLVETVRDACLKAARDAYENAGISGLCEEGRWECAVAAIRSLNLEVIISAMHDDPSK